MRLKVLDANTSERRGSLIHGDCLEVLKKLPDNYVDSMVTDPPAGINFMNLKFDHDKGGRHQWIAWLTEVMVECHRVLKPGGHALVWALPRTSHWTGTALEDAGFVPKDKIIHSFGTGFPKGQNISKALDKQMGVDRPVVGVGARNGNGQNADYGAFGSAVDGTFSVTESVTDEAKQWEGWGTQLKPAVEDRWLVQKPHTEKTIAQNVLKYGTGALNIDASRVKSTDGYTENAVTQGVNTARTSWDCRSQPRTFEPSTAGRWPANLILSHSPECTESGTKKVKSSHRPETLEHVPILGDSLAGSKDGSLNNRNSPAHGDPDGTETLINWLCVEGCPVLDLDTQSGDCKSVYPNKPEQAIAYAGSSIPATGDTYLGGKHSGVGYSDSGGASRFFKQLSSPLIYQAKAPTKERPKIDGKGHATVKSLELMRTLITLITPPNGIVLDPFGGSGTTGEAALVLGFKFLLIEQDADYCNLTEQRLSKHSDHFILEVGT